MKVKIKRNKRTTINRGVLLLITLIALNFLAHILRYATESTSIVTTMDKICLLILLVYYFSTLLKRHFSSNSKYFVYELVALIAFVFASVLGWLNGIAYYPELSKAFSEVLFSILSYYLFVFASLKLTIKSKDLDVIFQFITIVVLAAVVYAAFTQWTLIVEIIQTRNAKASYAFSSFFSQRNIYANACILGIISSLFLFSAKRKTRYIFYSVLFFVNIVLTDSQTALFTSVFFFLMFLFFNSKHRIFIITAILLVFLFLLVFLSPNFLNNLIPSLSRHMTSYSMDSGSLRLYMWGQGFRRLTETKSWIFGLGKGSNVLFLMPYYQYGSFHNSYVDALFQGGLIRLVVTIYVCVVAVIRMSKIENLKTKACMFAAFSAYCLYSFFEAGGAFFEMNYFGIIYSVIFLAIPRCYSNDITNVDMGQNSYYYEQINNM